MEEAKRNLRHVVKGGALVLCILFFTLPLVQCTQDRSLNASGWEIASATGDLFYADGGGHPLLFALIIVPAVLLILAFTKTPFIVLRTVAVLGLLVKAIVMIVAHVRLREEGLLELTAFNWFVLVIYMGLCIFTHYCMRFEKLSWKAVAIFKKIGDWVVVFICVIVMALCLLPMLNILARSLSGHLALIQGQVAFLPVDFTLNNYRFVLSDPAFIRSMLWTSALTAIVTVFSLSMTILCAFPMIYNLKGKRFLNFIIIFTMYFNAGIIPNYILMRHLGLLDNPLVLILPGAISVFFMIILRSFFYNVPESLRESAEIDGANPFVVLFKIYLPLSLPVLATLSLFYAVGRWNGFTDALMFLPQAREFHPIQLLLFNILQNITGIEGQEGLAAQIQVATEGMRAAAIMFATVPILCVYPWLQRYFISGVTIGAVKG